MKIAVGFIFAVFIFSALWGLNYFFRGAPLPSASAISKISIGYSDNTGELLPDDHEPKKYDVTDSLHLEKILEAIGDQLIAPMPLINSDDMDDGPGWILNVYFKDGGYRYIYVDKYLVSGKKNPNSSVYQYLKLHYS